MHVYSWTGGDGRIHYVDAAPEGPMLTISGEFIKGAGQAAEKILRLAEENASLKALRVRVETVASRDGYRDMTLAEMQGLVTVIASGQARELRAEHAKAEEALRKENAALRETAVLANRMTIQQAARIRRELLRFVSESQHRQDENSPDKIIAEHMRAEIIRICPGEDCHGTLRSKW